MSFAHIEHHSAFHPCRGWTLVCAIIGCLAAGLTEARADATVSNVTVSNGQSQLIEDFGAIQTAQNDSATTVSVQSGGSLLFWAGERVVLKPGFHASSGSFFWGTVDSDLNGYSDMEETQTNFVPGVPDAWLADHGVNLSAPVGSWPHSVADYQAAFQGGYDPDHPPVATTSTYALILPTPGGQFYGVTFGSWSITTAAGN